MRKGFSKLTACFVEEAVRGGVILMERIRAGILCLKTTWKWCLVHHSEPEVGHSDEKDYGPDVNINSFELDS
ncbi:hypothetical protein AC249_AIPGENE15158 [Exaiptasia diaphana]|nr:hypothetical protein AC249_AIPGENE15158 [Exaiptasia diaphana]